MEETNRTKKKSMQQLSSRETEFIYKIEINVTRHQYVFAFNLNNNKDCKRVAYCKVKQKLVGKENGLSKKFLCFCLNNWGGRVVDERAIPT